MCEATAFLIKNGQEEMFLEKVDRIIPKENDELLLEDIFGERRILKARIKEMSLVNHKIILEEI